MQPKKKKPKVRGQEEQKILRALPPTFKKTHKGIWEGAQKKRDEAFLAGEMVGEGLEFILNAWGGKPDFSNPYTTADIINTLESYYEAVKEYEDWLKKAEKAGVAFPAHYKKSLAKLKEKESEYKKLELKWGLVQDKWKRNLFRLASFQDEPAEKRLLIKMALLFNEDFLKKM